MQKFSEWIVNKDAAVGYVVAQLMQESLLSEGRKDPEKLRSRLIKKTPNALFDKPESDDWKKDIRDPASKTGPNATCPLTPLSGYETHIKAIQQFALASPFNFAQTLLFSPLSANVAFPKHWDNFQMLMMILKHQYPDKVSVEELSHVIDSFGKYLYSMAHTIGGWKLKTISYVWNQKEELMKKLISLAKSGNDEAMIQELIKIPGVQPVKAGFIAQLLFSKAGCIDTHNIDIYSKAFPDLADELKNPQQWSNEKGVPKYLSLLDKLQKKGIGTKELWDVWVDFVENYYKQISTHGMGAYTDMGTAIDDPDSEKYKKLKDVEIPKTGATTGGRVYGIRPVSGKMGRGASATHLQMDPDEALSQFAKMYYNDEPGSDAARAIPFRTDKFGRPLDKNVGLGPEPSLLKYFGQALTPSGVDPDMVRKIIQNQMSMGGKKAAAAKRAGRERGLF